MSDVKDETREKVRETVLAKVKEKYQKDNGDFDIDGLLEEVWRKDEKAHFAQREAAERRLKEANYLKELEEREKALKEKEEAELLQQQKYKELLDKKQAEFVELNKKLDELKGYGEKYNGYLAKQKEGLASKVANLSADNKELYELAAPGLGDDIDKLTALVDKLTKGNSELGKKEPVGGIEKISLDNDPKALYELKRTNPDLYQAKIRENSERGFKL